MLRAGANDAITLLLQTVCSRSSPKEVGESCISTN